MSRRIPILFLLMVLAVSVACTNKKVNNPLANVGSKQPDKVLFDRAMDALKHNRFDVARLTLQTLINTYPDSEYIARAKLGVADSWYVEGGSTAQAQAEIEYKDFITFFPNMPEAAEAQLKIANIHYQQMEKPDRDFTHAARAEEEYRNLILQWPDSKLVPEAKQRLMEVQEVLAQREFGVGRFYYLRQSYPAAIARLQSVVDKYPLYSGVDEALFLLGQSYEGEIARVRASPSNKRNEAERARMIQHFTNGAVDAYSKILTRYPLMERAEDAKQRLVALHHTVPRPTRAAVAQNKAEEESRKGTGMFGKMVGNFSKHPDVASATKVGEPSLADPQPLGAKEVVDQATRAMKGGSANDNNSVAVETVNNGAPPPNQAAPRSDAAVEVENPGSGSETTTPPPTTATDGAGAAADTGELKPNVAADPNELKPNVDSGGQTLPPPQQVNELSPENQAAPAGNEANTASSSSQDVADDATIASSKKKKKKGIKKIVPF
ncbi:MAG TPA: outer membrane protein assembly factor BamD [Terriglobales bacterium]|nr:outer membrane protein assembly factor BamD [Terriglobales bacterium]